MTGWTALFVGLLSFIAIVSTAWAFKRKDWGPAGYALTAAMGLIGIGVAVELAPSTEILQMTAFPGESGVSALTAILESKQFGGAPFTVQDLPPVSDAFFGDLSEEEQELGAAEVIVVQFVSEGGVVGVEVEVDQEVLERSVREGLGVDEFSEELTEFVDSLEVGPDPFVTFVELQNLSDEKPATPFSFGAEMRRPIDSVHTEPRYGCSCDGSSQSSPNVLCNGILTPGSSAFLRFEFGLTINDVLPGLFGGEPLVASAQPDDEEQFERSVPWRLAFTKELTEINVTPDGELELTFARFPAIDLASSLPSGAASFWSAEFSSENVVVNGLRDEPARVPSAQVERCFP